MSLPSHAAAVATACALVACARGSSAGPSFEESCAKDPPSSPTELVRFETASARGFSVARCNGSFLRFSGDDDLDNDGHMTAAEAQRAQALRAQGDGTLPAPRCPWAETAKDLRETLAARPGVGPRTWWVDPRRQFDYRYVPPAGQPAWSKMIARPGTTCLFSEEVVE